MSASSVMYALESDLLAKLAAELSKGNYGSAEWSANRLAAIGTFRRDVEPLIRQRTEEAIHEMQSEVRAAALRAAERVDRSIPSGKLSAALAPDASKSVRAAIEIWEVGAIDKLRVTGAKLLDRTVTMYEEAAQKATAKVLTGASTGREAMREMAREWGRRGVPALVDNAGRNWSPEAYTQTIVRSNVRRVSTDVQMARSRELGNDLVVISSHAGARPKCAPYQGKVFSLSGDDPNYPALATTSMGEPDGLFGINCGHEMHPYFPGQKIPYDRPGKRENDQQYQRSQQQRKLERDIRAAKRQQRIYESLGDTDAARDAAKVVRARQGKMREFLDSTGRTRRRDREQLL